jgi:hypothetical protein
MTFIEQNHARGEPVRARDLAILIRLELGLDVHPRSIERAVKEKKTARRS